MSLSTGHIPAGYQLTPWSEILEKLVDSQRGKDTFFLNPEIRCRVHNNASLFLVLSLIRKITPPPISSRSVPVLFYNLCLGLCLGLQSSLFPFNNQLDALIIQIYSVTKLYMFRASSLPIIRSSVLYIRHWKVS